MFDNELSRKEWADEVENLGRRKDFVVFTISMFYILLPAYCKLPTWHQWVCRTSGSCEPMWAEYTSSNSINKWNLTNIVSATKKILLECLFKELYNKNIFLWQGSQWSSGRCYYSFPPPSQPPNTHPIPWAFTTSLYANSMPLQTPATFHLKDFSQPACGGT